MIITDTHTHLYSESFKEDRNEMIQRAFEASVKNFVLPAIDSTYTSAMWELKNQYPESMHLMAGLHPTHVDPENIKAEMEHVKEELASKMYCAVGEMVITSDFDSGILSSILGRCFFTFAHWGIL